jgi:hypothetical protein
MKEYVTEILLAVSAIINAIMGWKLGGKQKAKNDEIQTKASSKATENDSIANGAERLIGTSERLMLRLEARLDVVEKENTKLKDDMNNVTVRLKIIESKCVGNCFQ